jgi:replication factor C subunit 1
MDIRNFFAKKKKSAETSESNSKNGKASSAKESSSNDDDDGRISAPKSSAAAASKKKATTANVKKKRKEVSPADFFNESSSKVKPPPTKRPSPPPSASRETRSSRTATTSLPLEHEKPTKTSHDTKKATAAPKESDPSKGQPNYFAKKRRSDDALSEKVTTVDSVSSLSKKEKENKKTNDPDGSKQKAAPESPPPTQQADISEGPEIKKKRVSQGASKSPAKPKPKTFSATEITEHATFPMHSATPMCLEGLTFCFSGVMENLDRQEASEMIKTLGGRVTTNVSSKTTYLVLGSILEDGRPVEQGSKYRRSESEANIVVLQGTGQFYGLLHKYSGCGPATASTSAPSTAASAPLIAPAKTSVSNPYASKPSNPYASKGNPYAQKPPSKADSSSSNAKPKAIVKSTGINDLWVDKYKPLSSGEILGNTESVKKLAAWLRTWEDRFNNPQASKKTFSAPSGPWKAALLSGPPGIGKTTTATVVAREDGRDVLEFNASDVRSKKALHEQVGDITGSSTLQFSTAKSYKTKRCIIMDEVDGMGAGDRGGVSELIQMIKKTKVPIICIWYAKKHRLYIHTQTHQQIRYPDSNDRQSQKLKSLIPYCM